VQLTHVCRHDLHNRTDWTPSPPPQSPPPPHTHRATVASELESLLGYSTFWALLSLSILTGSLADASLSGLPITAGPGPAVAAVVAAQLAFHARNW